MARAERRAEAALLARREVVVSEPIRWKDGGGPPEMRALFSGAKPSRALPESARTRARSRLAALTVPAAASALFGWKSVAVAAGIVTSGVVATAVALRMPEPSSAPAVVSAPAHESHEPPEPATLLARPTASIIDPVEEAPAPPALAPRAASAPRAHATHPAQASGDEREDTLAREVALLSRARASLAEAPRETLRLVDEHARAFPSGKLALERELVAVDALEALGRRDEARARAARLLTQARGTIYEARVRDRLGATSP